MRKFARHIHTANPDGSFLCAAAGALLGLERLSDAVMRKRRLGLAGLLAGLMALLVAVFARPAGSRDAILNIDGQNLHIEILGKSGPAVVFEAGLGNGTSTWQRVAGPVATFAQVVLYDRAGLGQSLPMVAKNSAVTADEVATRLHGLLAAADLRPPYVLVGHSLGGLYVQMFSKKYPREVQGVVLLDSSSTQAPSELKTRARLEPGSAAYLEEEGIAESNTQVGNGGSFPDVPLTVIAATDHGPFFKEWEPTLMQLQRRLATLSPQGTLIVAEGSGHDIQLDRPATVIDAIKRMLTGKIDTTNP
ncbi:MAG TPA: alpha/beta hydrolase [Xanthobacteraceae bacterium]|jgi:pimeloyl-ACP methyl ester carboxylesterase|nr:alpha/beta hydrolase [Xanthobacteraceae bacterium]